MKSIKFSIVLGIVSILYNSCVKTEQADLIIHNAKIYLVNTAFETAEAMAIKDGRIIETGPERQILNKYRYKEIYDAGKKAIYPGFIDGHCHLWNYAKSLSTVDVSETQSMDEVIAKLSDYIAKHPDETWIIGRGWDQNKWPIQTFPDNTMLDSLFPTKNIVLYRVDGHAIWCSSRVLSLAKVDSQTKVEGGQIVLKNGIPTGVLIDNAMSYVEKIIPPISHEKKIRLIKMAERNLLAQGITTIDDAGLEDDIIVLLQELDKDSLLSIKIYGMVWADSLNIEKYIHLLPYKNYHLHLRSFKFMADGALGSRGACLLKPYTDKESYYGTLLYPTEYLRKMAKRVFNAQLQMNTHCIGDSANRVMLNIYGEILQGTNDYRWRIEHAQIVDSQDIPKFKEYTIIPSVQPTHAISDKNWAISRLGNRIKNAYRYKTLLNQNKIIALGTDFPVEDISPFKTFYAAVFRQDYDGNGPVFFPEECLSRKEALMGMTIWNAIANFEENEKGSLEKGKAADFVVLNHDILHCKKNMILKTKVIRTYVDGKLVYSIN